MPDDELAAPTRLDHRQRRKIRRATRRREADPSETQGELNIVPLLDIVVNVMLFLLATTAATMAVARADATLPSVCRGAQCESSEPGLALSVTLTRAGILVASAEGMFAPGCEASAPGAVTAPPMADGSPDFEALARCLRAVHERHPSEREVILSADPEVPYEALVGAMDAAREGPSGVMFPEVRISAGVR